MLRHYWAYWDIFEPNDRHLRYFSKIEYSSLFSCTDTAIWVSLSCDWTKWWTKNFLDPIGFSSAETQLRHNWTEWWQSKKISYGSHAIEPNDGHLGFFAILKQSVSKCYDFSQYFQLGAVSLEFSVAPIASQGPTKRALRRVFYKLDFQNFVNEKFKSWK